MSGNLINGVWRQLDASFATFNPSDLDEEVAVYGQADAAFAEEAIQAARAALPGWRSHNIQSRSDILRRAGDALLADAEAIGRLLAREEGKVLREAVGEVVRAAQVFHYFSGETVRHPGQTFPSLRDGHSIQVDHEPVGVCALITPWNFPIAIPAWKVAAALAYGNTCVLKPSEFAPGCAVRLAEILIEAGLPAGALNLVQGDGRVLGGPLIAGADAVSFTGATPTGQAILAQAAPSMTKVQLELGGKNPLIVLDDADLDLAVEVALQGTFGQTGQRCTGSSRLIVTRGLHDAFVEKLAQRTRALKVGHALEPLSEIGPVATDAQLAKNLEFIASAKAEGGELVAGGDQIEPGRRGRYLAPTLFVGTRNDMRLNRHEVFGPVAGVIAVDDLDEAIAVARDCDLALSSGICTQDLRAAERFRRASPAGMVMVNTPTAGVEYHVPFGGRAPSGFGGREQGSAAADFFTEMKTTYVRHGVA
jgi:aldehyde dehydrogenase (NAD+)